MITYQTSDLDDPQPVDEEGKLPDGTQVIFMDGFRIIFGAGIFFLEKGLKF